MMKPSHALKAGIIVSIAVVILFVFSAAAPAMSSSQANAFASQANANLLPDPTLNSNVSWSTFYPGWNTMEYNNGSLKGNLTLDAQLSSSYKNPITVNPIDILANKTLTNNKLGTQTTTWENDTWSKSTRASTQPYQTLTNDKETLEIKVNTSTTGNEVEAYTNQIPITEYPSNNIQYDYLTMIYELSGPTTTGISANIQLQNGTDLTAPIKSTNFGTITPNEVEYFSQSLEQIQKEQKYQATFNTSGKGQSNYINIVPYINLPETTSTQDYTFTIYGMAFTDYQMSLGTNTTGTVYKSTGDAKLTSFNPSFSWQKIQDNGYSVSISQAAKNVTTQQSEISGNPSYVEQVTYEGSYILPMAPDLTYSSSVIAEKFNISTTQTTVLDINGLSLLNLINGKNGTITLMTVNPNQKTTLIQITEYTSSQWESISGPPGFFSVNGILYYFDEIVLGIIAVVGLAGGAAVARTRSLRRVK